MEKWLIPKMRQGKYKMSPKYLVLESKEGLRNDDCMLKGHRNQLKWAPTGQMEDNFCIKINNKGNRL